MKRSILLLLFLLSGLGATGAQVPVEIQVQILKAEDARRYDKSLEDLFKHPRYDVRTRAALAAGRIGDEAAIPALTALLEKEQSEQLHAMVAFALGEIESIKAADAILRALGAQAETRAAGSVASAEENTLPAARVSARLVEAAGKIAAANSKHPKAKELGKAIIATLEAENKLGTRQNRESVLLGLTALLRARPEGTDVTAAKFLTSADARVRADAANTLGRIRAKNANAALRSMLQNDRDPIARANAARALGAAEDASALEALTEAASKDADARVRVSAIRSLGALKDASAAGLLLDRAETLFDSYQKSKFRNPSEKAELIEIAAVLGRLLADTRNERAANFLRKFSISDNGQTAEIPIARFRVSPGRGDDRKTELTDWRQYSTMAQIVGEFATLETKNEAALKMKTEAPDILRPLAEAFAAADPKTEASTIRAAPDVLREYAKFKTADLDQVLRTALKNEDVFIRATAAELLADRPASKENTDALRTAFDVSLVIDTQYNDAQLAILDALFKLDRKQAVGPLIGSMYALDYVVRKKAFDLLADTEMQKEFPVIATSRQNARRENKHQVLPYKAGFVSKQGQILNTETDYRRAAARTNGTVRAVVTTEKGTFTIDLLPKDAPLTVDNFIKLARANYFNGLEVHRVVPNFVMQDGDPRGDGNGGPGWSIRCEINMLPYERGAVGMALSGKDTGGSQWFVTHSPQPHLDGGYTVFGKVNESGMKVVDAIVRGDKIISVRISDGTNRRRHDR